MAKWDKHYTDKNCMYIPPVVINTSCVITRVIWSELNSYASAILEKQILLVTTTTLLHRILNSK